MQLVGKKNHFVKLCLSLIISTLLTLVLLLFFSVIIYFTGANSFWLKAVNLIIRLFAVCSCVLIYAPQSKGILSGAILGVLSFASVQLAFAILFKGFKFDNFLMNSLFSVIFGAIFGIICVNLKNRAKST